MTRTVPPQPSGSRGVLWLVDDRRASLRARAVRAWSRLTRRRDFSGGRESIARARAKQRRGDAPPTRWTRRSRRVSHEWVDGVSVWRVRPRLADPVARVLYLHGGGYIHPLTADYWRLVRDLTRVPAEVVVPAYPLAPDATVDDVLPRLVALAGTLDDLPLVVAGDSAGGALAIIVGRHVEPDGILALCPWLDAELDDPRVEELAPDDPVLQPSGLRAAAALWAGGRSPKDPDISPLHLNPTDLAPIDLWIGDHDVLRPAVDRFVAHAAEAAVPIAVHEVPAMFHVWMTQPIPERRRTRREILDLVAQRVSATP